MELPFEALDDSLVAGHLGVHSRWAASSGRGGWPPRHRATTPQPASPDRLFVPPPPACLPPYRPQSALLIPQGVGPSGPPLAKISEGRLTDNVTDRLPDALGSTVTKKLRTAHHLADPMLAEAELEALDRSLDRSHRARPAPCRKGWPRR